MIIYICVQLLIVINCCIGISEGTVIISPSPRAAVCNVGGELQVMCSTTDRYLIWNVTFVTGNDRIERTLSSTIRNPERLEVNSTVFTFSRTSELGSIGLVSKLVVSSVSQNLNETNITCIEVGPSATKAVTTVYVIGNASDQYLNSPEVSINSEILGTDDVSVVLDMQIDNALLTTNISSSPELEITVNTSSVHFTIPYNTPTNVSISANLCGIQKATIIELNYAKCNPPLTSDNSGVRIATRYSGLALEGTTITFNCSSGFLLSGPKMARCASTGQWNPDPKDMKCIANCGHPQPPVGGYILPYISTAEGARVIFMCRNSSQTPKSRQQHELEYSAVCNSKGKWEPDPTELCYGISNKDNSNILTIIAIASSVCFVLVVSTLIISFIVGFTCGRCSNKCRAEDINLESLSHNRSLHQAMGYPNSEAIYECPDIAAGRVKCKNHEPELEENVAYAPLQHF